MVKSANRVIQILKTVGSHPEGLAHSEIAETLEIPKSSLSALLVNLLDCEYLTIDNSTRRYTLGPQILVLAGRYLEKHDAVEQGHSLISELRQETGEVVSLAVPAGGEAIIVYRKEGLQPIVPSLQVGTRLPLYASAPGKCILAHYKDEKLEEYFASVALTPFTRNTVTDPKRLMVELRVIRGGGFGYNHEEYREGVMAIAAPVFDFYGQLVAALAIAAPTFRIDTAKEKYFEDKLGEITNRFSRRLGFTRKIAS